MKTIIEFSKTCAVRVFGQNDDPPTILQSKVSFRVVVARPVDELGTVTGPVRADAYQLVDGPMNTPVWMSLRNHYLDMVPSRPAALDSEVVIGIVMDRLAMLATSPAACRLQSQLSGNITLINLGELL